MMRQNKINNSKVMNQTELRHILSAKFDFDVWKMLGHIFENLLEDNKDKGAFYTPKEI